MLSPLFIRPPLLAYPAGYAPGFDPSHIAAPSTQFSGIAVGGNFVNLLTGKPGIVSGSTVSNVINSQIGPASSFSGTGLVEFAFPSTNFTPVTLGVIFVPNSFSGTNSFLLGTFASGTNAPELLLNNTSGNEILFSNGNVQTQLLTGLVAGVPYFVAASWSTSLLVINWVSTRLDTGACQFGQITGSANSAGASQLNIGNRGDGTRPGLSAIAAAMFSSAFMERRELWAWAADPWSFWYPLINDYAFDENLVGLGPLNDANQLFVLSF